MSKFIPQTALVLCALVTGLTATNVDAAPAGATPVYLHNASFDQPTAGTVVGDTADTPALCSGAGGANSASSSWTTWTNTVLTQVTSWITLSPDGNYLSNLVYAGGPGDGLVQVLSGSPTSWVHVPMNTVTDKNSVGVWVWVVKGKVSVQLGNGGQAGGALHESTTTGGWEWIGGCGRADGLNNEITIYASEPSLYYVDDASVSYDPVCDGPL